MKKKILGITSTWDADYATSVLNGVTSRLKGKEYITHIFNVYDDVQETEFYKMENEILQLPNLEEYSGILYIVNSVDTTKVVKEMLPEVNKLGIPMVSLDQHLEGVTFCGIDNYASMYNIVEHMIVEHECKIFNYIGGPENHSENKERFQAFCDCLKAHGLEIDTERVRFYRFLKQDGIQAYSDLKKLNKHMADAVICANDNMALGYSMAAETDEFIAPTHYKITGFDNIFAGQTFFPSITSSNRNLEKLGYEATDCLIQMMEGAPFIKEHNIEGYIAKNESCGCERCRNIREDYLKLQNRKRISDTRSSYQNLIRRDMCSSFDMEKMAEVLASQRVRLGAPKMALCINNSFYSGGYEKRRRGFSARQKYYVDEVRGFLKRKNGLIPEELKDDSAEAYVISPLHYRLQNYGYCVMPYTSGFELGASHRVLMDSISLALENICQRRTLAEMNDKLSKLYVLDPLTGLYNRFGYTSMSDALYEEVNGQVYVVFVDMDNLKTINDIYGHARGDEAIKAVANAITNVFTDTDIHVRMGGDEFLVMGVYESEDSLEKYASEINEYLEEYRKNSEFPYKLEASVGYVWNEGDKEKLSLEALVQKADKCMYEIKQAKKNKK